MKDCPYCAEAIQDEAVYCRHCQANLAPAAPTVIPPGMGSPSCQLCGGPMRRKRIGTNTGGGCLLLVIGLVLLLFAWPIGLIVIVGALAMGVAARNYWVCRSCGAKVERHRGAFE